MQYVLLVVTNTAFAQNDARFTLSMPTGFNFHVWLQGTHEIVRRVLFHTLKTIF